MGRLRGLAVSCGTTYHYHPCSNLCVGISEGWFIFLTFITFGGRSAHLAYRVHKSGRKTPIINALYIYVKYLKILKYCFKSIGKTQSFNWNTSLNLSVIWNNLLKDFQYLPVVKSCHPLLPVGAITVSNPRRQLVTDATPGSVYCITS